ncbi:hypothetical protein EJ03DRAFT_268755 [Teratosphaeria nubilosa]|uniref:Uncharacterized protein n=1 Tax=Teratosphaeria nubilosa TaxID=161662 RepID=A0A6G1LEL5_9PEZI|nr:hypothetical protein EJ03DRAFT_268755 [Teratosphaeria nubilosa]
MLATSAPSLLKRPPPERPVLATQASFVRDRDASSTLSPGGPNGAVATSNAALASVPTSGSNPSAIYQTIHETSAKRMATIDYFRKVHEGNIFYFSTLHYSQSNLNTSIPSLHPAKLARRATGYMALGYSLPLLLDLSSNSPLEYLKALAALLSEFETYQNLAAHDGAGSSLSRARVGQMFKTGIGLGTRSGMRSGRRASAATDSIASDTARSASLSLPSGEIGSPNEAPSPLAAGHDFHHLLTPHLPFDPDFSTTFSALCDTLIEIYANLLQLVHSPDICTPAVADAFTKADKAVRKILVSNVMREFEDGTRAGVKTEVAGLGRLVLGGLM